MAILFGIQKDQLNNIDFSPLRQGYDYKFYNNINYPEWGIVFEDIFELYVFSNGSYLKAEFRGSDISYSTVSNVPSISGGTFNGFKLKEWTGTSWKDVYGIAGFSVSAKDMYIAVMSIPTDDDRSIIQYILSGNDQNNANIRFDATVKVGDIVNQWFGTAAPTAKQSQDVIDTKLLDINASTWTDKIQINRVAKASDSGDLLEALAPDLNTNPRVGSVLSGGAGNDVLAGRAGWDVLDGGNGDDLIRGGNGRDIITGGLGRDELHGDFGWNTYKSEKDGVSDLIAIKSDQYLVNWIYGKAGNNADGSKCDIIEGLDAIDKIRIIGVDTRDITFASSVTHSRNNIQVTGIGIYAKGALEALYTGAVLTINQITQMTSGDASAAAMANQINSYGTW